MQIIDKNKDYYDYLQKVYGRDTTITYDRRGSRVMTDLFIVELVAPPEYYYEQKNGALFVLEVGEVQYLFRVMNVAYAKFPMSGALGGEIELLTSFSDHKHYFEKEMTLVPAKRSGYNYAWFSKKYKECPVKSYSELKVIPEWQVLNPILRETSIPSFITEQEMWVNLTNYISSKYNDKTVTIVNSDVDKAVMHGFDKNTSFRNPIKL